MAKFKVRKDALGNWSTRSRSAPPVGMPNVCGTVKQQMYSRHMSVPTLASLLSISTNRAYRLLSRADWRVSEILNVSAAIKLNLFEWYAEQTRPQPVVTEPAPAAIDSEAELNILRQKTAVLEAENRLLRDMVELLKAKQ